MQHDRQQRIEEGRESMKRTAQKWFSISEDVTSNDEIRSRLLAGGKITGTNMCVMICAIVIASVGLNTDSVAGIIGQTREDKANNIIPGVAIATALMPPLCTCGYAIANGKWHMLLGALYLFVINTYFILISATVVLSALRIPKVKELTEAEWRKRQGRMIRNTILLVLPSIAAVISIYLS